MILFGGLNGLFVIDYQFFIQLSFFGFGDDFGVVLVVGDFDCDGDDDFVIGDFCYDVWYFNLG